MRTLIPRRALLFPLLLPALGGCLPALAGPAAAPTTVLVVRHAERASATDRDSPLSAAGEARARALAETLADAGVSAILATEYQRTRNTARPLAERLGIPVRVEAAAGSAEASAAALARRIRTEHAGETVLVVGHSNTVPLIVAALGGGEVGPLGEDEYDRLFVVLLPAAGPPRTVRARYGAPSSPSPAAQASHGHASRSSPKG